MLEVLDRALVIGGGTSNYANTLPGDASGAVAMETESLDQKKKKVNKAEEDASEPKRGGDRPDEEFCPEQLKIGTDHEMEHTSDLEVAKRTAKDHLIEIPDYYTRLGKLEDDYKKEQEANKAQSDKEDLSKPPVSEAQRRFMGAAAAGKIEGVPASVGKEYLEVDEGGKLPEKKSEEDEVEEDEIEEEKKAKRKAMFKSILTKIKQDFPNSDIQTVLNIADELYEKRLQHEPGIRPGHSNK